MDEPNPINHMNKIIKNKGLMRMLHLLDNFLNQFFDEEKQEINRKGLIVMGVIVFLALNVLGYIEGGGLFPWE